MDDIDQLTSFASPTAARPLLGMTVLAVEDSRYASDAMRLLCLRSGARIRRADCIESARRHLQVYRPSVILVDVGLPDGSGLDLIDELSKATPRIDVILAMSGDDHLEARAANAGADTFIAKPLESIAAFQQIILAHLPQDRQPSGPRPVIDEKVTPDPQSYQDDMAHVANLINDGSEPLATEYVAQFVTGVARSAHDSALAAAGEELRREHASQRPTRYALAKLAGLVQERLEKPVAM